MNRSTPTAPNPAGCSSWTPSCSGCRSRSSTRSPVTWQVLDDHHVRGTYTYGANTITAELAFNDDHELVDFFSDDRTAVSTDGKTFTPQRWSTPISDFREFGLWRLGTNGEGHWHAPDGEFAYLEYHLDEIGYNATDLRQPTMAGTHDR